MSIATPAPARSISKLRWGVALAITLGMIIWILTRNFGAGVSAGLIAVTGLGLNLDNVVLVAPLARNLPVWGRRIFFTAGMAVSVIGVQLLVPICIVGLISGIGVTDALNLALFHSDHYSRLQEASTQFIDAGATSFLALMSFTYMLDPKKDVHWWGWAETRLAKWGEHTYLGFGIVGAALLVLAGFAPTDNRQLLVFVCFGSFVAFTFFHMAGDIITKQSERSAEHKGRVSWYKVLLQLVFIMVLESLFSIDSLASAFAISSAIIPIVVGLVGSALFMRAAMFDMAESDRLSQYRYIQTSAYWAILYLSVVTWLSAFGVHVPELLVGCGGSAIIAWGGIHSHIENRRAEANPTPQPKVTV